MSAKKRNYRFPNREDIKEKLEVLLQQETSISEYKQAMYDLGCFLGAELEPKLSKDKRYTIAVTAEDADTLAKGIFDALGSAASRLSLACFWNNRQQVAEGLPSTAPIIRRYLDEGVYEADSLIVVKSIISGSCVVRTNLTDLIEHVVPKDIFVVAPVMHSEAKSKLELEFPDHISEKFIYEYLAIDENRDEITGEVKPGIGGNLYQLLGFVDQAAKNKMTPQIVRERMFASA